MTVIVNSIWGGRVSQIADRQISRPNARSPMSVVDEQSTKVCIILCADALASIAYTGVAVVHQRWMDTVIASCLAHRPLRYAMAQPGARSLARPIHTIIHELAINLNGQLNSDPRAREANLCLSVTGWHLGRRPRPFLWELVRGAKESNGMRYFTIKHRQVGQFLRHNPMGLWAETLGDPGATVDNAIQALSAADKLMTHDDVEWHIKTAISERAKETATVGFECLAVQLDPFDSEGPIQITRYPGVDSPAPELLMTCWVLMPGLICSPGTESAFGCTYSACGRYLIGGFSGGSNNLKVRTRLPLETARFGGPVASSYGTQTRKPTS